MQKHSSLSACSTVPRIRPGPLIIETQQFVKLVLLLCLDKINGPQVSPRIRAGLIMQKHSSLSGCSIALDKTRTVDKAETQ